MNLKKSIGFLVIAVLAIAGGHLFLSKKKKETVQTGGEKLSVVTTLFPLYDFAKEIGGGDVDVTLLLPPGVEAHAYEPKPNDMLKINEADVFVYTGKFMEPWAEDVIKGMTGKNVRVVDASEGINLISGTFHDEDEPVGSMDPHIWLGFDNAEIMVRNIERGMEEQDPENADVYKRNADTYVKKLMTLDESYANALSRCKSKEIVYGGHYAFGYLAHRYGLEYTAAQGLSPDAEPTARDLAKLSEQLKRDRVQYVFYEELSSPKVAETLANETSAKLLLLNAAHNVTKEDMQKGVTFVEIMEKNLENLRVGLGCGVQ